MCSRVFMFLIGAVYFYYQVLASDVYVAELMVESNTTLEAQTILSALTSTELQLNNTSGAPYKVNLLENELIAECLIVGDDSTCNCSKGYIWSNEVCYNYNCCRETDCTKNVSHITPLCVAKTKVLISGKVKLTQSNWDATKTNTLVTAFEGLNGFGYLNVTSERLNIAEFEVAVSVKMATTKLQDLVTDLETSLTAVLSVSTEGMATIDSPQDVCYLSSPKMSCTLEEATDSSSWTLSRQNERFELNNGSVVQIEESCSTLKHMSCVAITLQKVTGIWSGTYECGFTSGSVKHSAKTQLTVALLPDVINLRINPLIADCSEKEDSTVAIDITATISASTENFNVSWTYKDKETNIAHRAVGDDHIYTFTADISCKNTPDAQYVKVTFKNSKKQVKSAKVDIPVVYVGAKSCSEELFWPKTPAGDTVINRTCTEGRTGYMSRTCEPNASWQPVFSYCVNQELNKVLNAADNFLKGLGASQEMAMDIFEGLANSSTLDSDSTDTSADISASINILEIMAEASKKMVLQDDVLPNFVNAASNMLNKTWDGFNKSTLQHMSSNYLHSLEDLVKNIKVNKSNGLNSENLDLKFCSGSDCNVTVFDIGVKLNSTTGIMKAVAVKNLMNKLRNSYSNAVPTSLLLSATLEDSGGSFPIIRLDFPNEQQNPTKPLCVFWNTTERDWSEAGCFVKTGEGNHIICECNHLTSFSVLMAKGDISTDVLDIITSVGLGVSVCSLLIFLTIEFLVWSAVVKSNLSHFRHTAMVNIAMFLLLADCSFLASTSPETLSDTWCLTLTICKHLFFLGMFSWMLCLSVMLVHQLIFVFSPLRKRVFMFFSGIVGYVCPILIVGSSYMYCKYTNKPYYNPKTCWLVFERLLEGSVHAFLLPVGTVTLTNLFSMVVVILTLVKSSVPEGSKADDKETAKSILKVVVFLTPVFGVTWTIGFALLILEESNAMFVFANYSFTILNSFQGLFILLTGCFAEQKVRGELVKFVMAKSKGKSESMKNLTSTTCTKDK